MDIEQQRFECFLVGFSGASSGAAIANEDRLYLEDLIRQVRASRQQLDLSEVLEQFRARFEEFLSGQVTLSDEMRAAFLCGMFGGTVQMGLDPSGRPYLEVSGAFELPGGLELLSQACGTPLHREAGRVSGLLALDVAGRVVGGGGPVLPSQRAMFGKWCTRISQLETKYAEGAEIRVQRVHPDAQLPKKERISDSGYDLTLLYVKSTFGRTVLFGTGLIVEPPIGWYLDVVPRSSIIKRGYILANSVGIIDRSYRGEILVPLIKIDAAAPELELPARVAQLIPRPIVHFPVSESEELSVTERGAGGFGSTGR